MLEPYSIPAEEPEINVGIFLPEDNRREIEIEAPSGGEFYVIASDSVEFLIPPGSRVRFSEADGEILMSSIYSISHIAGEWFVNWLNGSELKKDNGILVKDVPAGRGFHWEKNIDQYLPGKLHIFPYGTSLIMINELPLEFYLACVATSEMSAACPVEYIRAQTIIARSWMLANVEQKHRNLGMDVCNDDCCQRYQGTGGLSTTALQTALETRGLILMYQGKICDTRYSKCCGGIIESFEHVWGGTPIPYLTSYPDTLNPDTKEFFPLLTESSIERWIKTQPKSFCSPHYVPEGELTKYLGKVDVKGSYFRWSYTIQQEYLKSRLKELYGIDASYIKEIKPGARGNSGRLKQITLVYFSPEGIMEEHSINSEYEIRRFLHPNFLFSSAFVIKPQPAFSALPEAFQLLGAGWGHGVGFCQIGGLGMALQGYNYEDILEHYFPDTELTQIYK